MLDPEMLLATSSSSVENDYIYELPNSNFIQGLSFDEAKPVRVARLRSLGTRLIIKVVPARTFQM